MTYQRFFGLLLASHTAFQVGELLEVCQDVGALFFAYVADSLPHPLQDCKTLFAPGSRGPAGPSHQGEGALPQGHRVAAALWCTVMQSAAPFRTVRHLERRGPSWELLSPGRDPDKAIGIMVPKGRGDAYTVAVILER